MKMYPLMVLALVGAAPDSERLQSYRNEALPVQGEWRDGAYWPSLLERLKNLQRGGGMDQCPVLTEKEDIPTC